MRILLPALLALTACGKSGDPTPDTHTTVRIDKVDEVGADPAAALQFHVVDHDSDYMRRVFVHAGATPVAGITGHADVWKVEQGPPRTGRDFYLEATDTGGITGRARLERYFAALARDPGFALPPGHQLAFERTGEATWRSYYLDSAIALDGNAVAEVELGHDDRPTVLVGLTPTGGRTLATLTARIAGGKLAAVSRGEVLSAPIVTDQIAGGRVAISFADDRADAARALVDALAP